MPTNETKSASTPAEAGIFNPEHDRVLRLPEVMRITGKGRTQIYTDPEFPRPIKIGARSSGWTSSEIGQYVNRRLARRDAAAKEAT